MNTTESNKKIAEFIGYYQPKEVKDDLFSFEVYSSKVEAQKDYPKDDIITYFGKDIEDFQFVDEPQYHSDWNWLMEVVIECFNKYDALYDVSVFNVDNQQFKLNDALLETNIESLYKAVVTFIDWYNENKTK